MTTLFKNLGFLGCPYSISTVAYFNGKSKKMLNMNIEEIVLWFAERIADDFYTKQFLYLKLVWLKLIIAKLHNSEYPFVFILLINYIKAFFRLQLNIFIYATPVEIYYNDDDDETSPLDILYFGHVDNLNENFMMKRKSYTTEFIEYIDISEYASSELQATVDACLFAINHLLKVLEITPKKLEQCNH